MIDREEMAQRLAVAGFVGGAVLGSIGYFGLILLIEFFLTPPFKSPPNYGQFGFDLVGVAFYMSIFGLCLGSVPYWRALGYILIHALGLFVIFSIDWQFFTEVDWREAPMAAMIFLFSLPTPVAIVCDLWFRRSQRNAMCTNGRTSGRTGAIWP